MKLKRVVSKKTTRVGYRGRYTDPITGRRVKHTEWFADRRLAEDAWRIFLDGLNARKKGLPDNSGWELSYSVIVQRFLAEAPISSPTRRARLKHDLELNLVGMAAGSDFTAKGPLTAKCRKLAEERGEEFVRRCIQQPLKQVSAWGASIGLFPYDALHSWKRLPCTEAPARRQAFSPDEIRAIFAAADDMDALLDRPYPPAIVFKTILVTGNRPGALFDAKVKDLRGDRIQLAPGHGKKHNGRCMIPAPFAGELARYIAVRKASPADPLLVSPRGGVIDSRNIQETWRRAAILAFVRLAWPQDDADAANSSPVEVALAIHTGKPPGFDGTLPTDPAKLEARETRRKATEALAKQLQPHVAAALENRPLYALRHTHISWSMAAGVNRESRRAQVGHRGGDLEETHYIDPRIVDPAASAQAVYEILTGTRQLIGAERLEALPLAAGAENMAPVVAPDGEKQASGVKSAFSQTVVPYSGSPRWIRTINPVINSHMLYR